MITKEEFFGKVWDALVWHAGASQFKDERDRFVWLQTREHVPEYRFGGKLGFGGKFWRNASRFYVSAYQEDVKARPSMRNTIDATNAALDALAAEYPEAKEWT